MKVAQVAKPNAPLETVARASGVVAVLGNSGLGHLAVGRYWCRRLARDDRAEPAAYSRRAGTEAGRPARRRIRRYLGLPRAHGRRGDDRDLPAGLRRATQE